MLNYQQYELRCFVILEIYSVISQFQIISNQIIQATHGPILPAVTIAPQPSYLWFLKAQHVVQGTKIVIEQRSHESASALMHCNVLIG